MVKCRSVGQLPCGDVGVGWVIGLVIFFILFLCLVPKTERKSIDTDHLKCPCCGAEVEEKGCQG